MHEKTTFLFVQASHIHLYYYLLTNSSLTKVSSSEEFLAVFFTLVMNVVLNSGVKITHTHRILINDKSYFSYRRLAN